MRAKFAVLSLSIFAGAVVCSGQTAPDMAPIVGQAPYSGVYCSGFIRDNKVSEETRIVSTEQSSYKIVFSQGDLVIVNQGEDKGVRVGDRFMVVRPDVELSSRNSRCAGSTEDDRFASVPARKPVTYNNRVRQRGHCARAIGEGPRRPLWKTRESRGGHGRTKPFVSACPSLTNAGCGLGRVRAGAASAPRDL